jgi:hypothetical protein
MVALTVSLYPWSAAYRSFGEPLNRVLVALKIHHRDSRNLQAAKILQESLQDMPGTGDHGKHIEKGKQSDHWCDRSISTELGSSPP